MPSVPDASPDAVVPAEAGKALRGFEILQRQHEVHHRGHRASSRASRRALLMNVSPAIGEFTRSGWLPYPPAQRSNLFARRWRRLFSVTNPDIGRRHHVVGGQSGDHDPEDARAGHSLSADADILLSGVQQP